MDNKAQKDPQIDFNKWFNGTNPDTGDPDRYACGAAGTPFPNMMYGGFAYGYNGFHNQHPEQFENCVKSICSSLTVIIRSRRNMGITEAFARESEWYLVSNLTILKLRMNANRFYFTVIRVDDELIVELFDIMNQLSTTTFKVSLIRKDHENKEQATN